MKLEEYYRPRLSEVGYDLLAVFSRFEYALKKGGFRRENYPDAAWPTFAGRLDATRCELVCQLRGAPHLGGADRREVSRVAEEKRPIFANPIVEGNRTGCRVRLEVLSLSDCFSPAPGI